MQLRMLGPTIKKAFDNNYHFTLFHQETGQIKV